MCGSFWGRRKEEPMDYLKVLKALLKNRVNFVVAGGFAAIAHGVVRVTLDLDLILGVSTDDIGRAWDVLNKLGFLPRQPVHKKDVTHLPTLQKIIQDKHMKALSFFHDQDSYVVVDLLVGAEFELKKNDWVAMDLFGLKCPVLTVEKLIELKRRADREKDREDIRELQKKKGN